MIPEWRSAPAVLRLCGGLLLLLLLLLNPQAVRSDCGPPPDMPNATPVLKGATTFPVDKTVYYSCNRGYLRVPGKTHTIQCLSDNTWLQIDPNFCGRSCPTIRRLGYATLKKIYIPLSYYPAGTVVGYDCAPGYERIPAKPAEVTCLDNYTWSNPDVFCKKKPCAHPGELKNGYINITDGLLLASRIVFSCNLGYKLIGATFAQCVEIEKNMTWHRPLPTCKEIHCEEPPQIENGKIQQKLQNYLVNNSVTYVCDEGYTLMGTKSISCVVTGKSEEGKWSDVPPTCKENTAITDGTTAASTPTVPTSTTKPSTTQKSTSSNPPATRGVAVPRATTRFHPTSTAKGRGTLSSSGTLILVSGYTCKTLTVLLMTVTLGYLI